MITRPTVRIGVIGRGFGSRVVAPVFRDTDGCTVAAVVSARDDAAVADLCARADVDLVAVHSPPFMHLRHVRMAIEGGRRAVLCDKPFGRNAEEAREMCRLAAQAGVMGLVNFQFRYSPARARLHHLVELGAIGRPEHVLSSTFLAATRVPLRPHGWLFDAGRGGGWIGAGGSHTIDFLRWVFGDVGEVWTQTRTSISERPDSDGNVQSCSAEDSFTAVVNFCAGVSATIDSSFASAVNLQSRTTVLGSAGTIELLGEQTLELDGPGGGRQVIDCTSPHPHEAFRRWADIVRGAVASGQTAPGMPTFADGLACARVLDCMRNGGGRISPALHHPDS